MKKGRLLFLEHYLLDHTDEDHPITTEELINVCKEHGYDAHRNTIRDDIAALKEEGLDVITDRTGKGNGYYIYGRSFDLAELKTLADAVSSSHFIPMRKSSELIDKIAGLTNEQNREYVKIKTVGMIKSEAPGTFLIVDTIESAIVQGKKISFQYIDYLPTKELILRHEGKIYTVSPYAFLWNNDRYYILSYSEEKQCIIPFRIDRIRNVNVLDEEIVKDENFDLSEYSRKIVKMFDGNLEEECVILYCDNSLMLNVIDRFGQDVDTAIVDEGHFSASVNVIPSTTFFSWVFQFDGEITIAGPASVKKAYEEMINKVMLSQTSTP